MVGHMVLGGTWLRRNRLVIDYDTEILTIKGAEGKMSTLSLKENMAHECLAMKDSDSDSDSDDEL